MKFNPKQTYGIITGHPWARYEQNGVLFDVAGRQPNEDEQSVDIADEDDDIFIEPVNNLDRDFELDNAQDFLKNILAEGPLTRSSIYKEAENNNQNWEKVKIAFAKLGGETFTRRNVIHWKLKKD